VRTSEEHCLVGETALSYRCQDSHHGSFGPGGLNAVPRHLRVLRVESGSLSVLDTQNGSSTQLLDVRASRPDLWWQRRKALLDLLSSLHAKSLESQYDIVWAGSENIGIILSFMNLRKPLVVVAHHMRSPAKAKLTKVMGIVNKWSGIGFLSDESRQFFIDYFGVPADRLFQYESAKYLNHDISRDLSYDGPIVSVGVAKRDYSTLVTALTALPGYETELITSSKFGDHLRHRATISMPTWANLVGWLSEEELLGRYRRARFAAIPLHDTTHSGAGINAVLEAGAFSKAVIATRTGGMSTFVRDGETGILVPPYDVKAWRRAIETLSSQPELAKQMGQAGRRYMESRFNPEKVSAGIAAFLNDLLPAPGVPTRHT